MSENKNISEVKASMGDPSEVADAVTPKGGSNHKRGADKTGGEKSPISQGNSPMGRAGMMAEILTAMKGMDTNELQGLRKQISGDSRNGPGEHRTILQGNSKLKEALVNVLKTINEEDVEDDDLAVLISYLEDEDEREPVQITAEDVDTGAIEEFLTNNELSEEAVDKIRTIYEVEVVNRVNNIVESINTDNEQELAETEESLIKHVDDYLNYVVEQWVDNNKIELENHIRTEIAEGFLKSLGEAFAEHYIQVPNDQIDVVEALGQENKELEESLNQAIEDNVNLIGENESLRRDAVLAEASDGMTVMDAEKLIELTDGIAFEDEDTFARKVETIREGYFTGGTEEDNLNIGATLVEQGDEEDGSLIVEEGEEEFRHPGMKQYLDHLRRGTRE